METRTRYRPTKPWKTEEDKRAWLRRTAPMRLQVLCDHILSPFRGYGDLGPFHRLRCEEMDWDLEHGHNSVSIWSRGLWKTKTLSVGRTIQMILRNPNITILLRHFDEDIASEIVQDINEHFCKNDWLRYCFPEFCPKPGEEKRWCSTKTFTTPARTIPRTEPTILAEGLNSTVTGRHFDHIHDDDVETEKSVGKDVADAVREKHWKKWLDWVNLAERPNSEMAKLGKHRGTYSCVGTFWHYDGILKRAQKMAAEFQFKFRIFPAYDPKTDKLVCQQAYPRAALNRDRAALKNNPYEFNCAILCEPNDPTNQAFRVDDSLFESAPPEPKRVVRKILSVDPSYTTHSSSDYIGMVFVEILDNDHWVVTWCNRTRLQPLHAVRHLVEVFQRLRPDLIYLEEIAAGKVWGDLLRRQAEDVGARLPVFSVAHHKVQGKKDNRIRMVLGRVEERRLTLLRSGPGVFDLVDEMKHWVPDAKGNRDDLLDALAMAIEYAPVGRPNHVQRTFEKGTFGELNQKIEAEQRALRGRDRLRHQRQRYGEALQRSAKPWVLS